MKHIKLMPDYECYRLWRHGDGQVGNISNGSLQERESGHFAQHHVMAIAPPLQARLTWALCE